MPHTMGSPLSPQTMAVTDPDHTDLLLHAEAHGELNQKFRIINKPSQWVQIRYRLLEGIFIAPLIISLLFNK